MILRQNSIQNNDNNENHILIQSVYDVVHMLLLMLDSQNGVQQSEDRNWLNHRHSRNILKMAETIFFYIDTVTVKSVCVNSDQFLLA